MNYPEDDIERVPSPKQVASRIQAGFERTVTDHFRTEIIGAFDRAQAIPFKMELNGRSGITSISENEQKIIKNIIYSGGSWKIRGFCYQAVGSSTVIEMTIDKSVY